MSRPAPTVAVSGATGFLGSALCRHLVAHGFPVRALSRRPTEPPADLAQLEWFRCALPDDVDGDAFAGADVLVHCAYEMRFTSAKRARAVNVAGSDRIFRAAREAGVRRIVFLSSMSAYDETTSIYGRTKLEVEALLAPDRDLAVRPGHIVGEGGVFWRTAESIAKMPFIPLFYGGKQLIQTIWVGDVCEGIRRAIDNDGITGTLLLSERVPVTLRDLYGTIATAIGKRPRFLRLPGNVAMIALRTAERSGFPLPLSSDNLLGLKHLRAFDVDDDLRRIGLEPRKMRESVAEIQWHKLAPK